MDEIFGYDPSKRISPSTAHPNAQKVGNGADSPRSTDEDLEKAEGGHIEYASRT